MKIRYKPTRHIPIDKPSILWSSGNLKRLESKLIGGTLGLGNPTSPPGPISKRPSPFKLGQVDQCEVPLSNI